MQTQVHFREACHCHKLMFTEFVDSSALSDALSVLAVMDCLVRFASAFCDALIICGLLQGASGAELKASCTEAGMFALRERRIHVTQEDFEMAVAKVMKKDSDKNMSLKKLWK